MGIYDREHEDPHDRPYAGLIGLDGRFRKSPPAAYGIDAVKGRWIDDATFEVERRILGHGETEIWNLRFDGQTIEAGYQNTDGVRQKLHGRVVPASPQ